MINTANLPQAAVDATKEMHDSLRRFIQAQENAITEEARGCKIAMQAAQSQQAREAAATNFRQQMAEAKKSASTAANQQRDAYFHKMIAAGASHPDAQNAIINLSQTVSGFVEDDLLKGIAQFATNLADKIEHILNESPELIAGFFGQCLKAVDNFFKSLNLA